MPAVSNGWGHVVAVQILTYWLLGFSEFVWWLHEDTLYTAIMTIAAFLFSLAVLWPLAMTSSNCDELMTAFNTNRLAYVHDTTACVKIMNIETALRRLNLDQGLGFSIGGSVVNTRKLIQIFISVASIVPPIFATVVALRPTTEGMFACQLRQDQALALQTVTSTFNSTCIYNVSISTSGVLQW
jgi:hypothetical protein